MATHRRKDITGERFGRLVAVRYTEKSRYGGWKWLCRCDCGGFNEVAADRLKKGEVQSCGCLHKEIASKRLRTHGESGTLLYKIWASMRERCNNPKSHSYHRYGARGITVDPRWDSYEQWKKDMGPRPSSRYSIERLDNNGPYSPENCIWALPKQQCRNSRKNRLLTAGGVTKTLSEWAEDLGTRPSTIVERLRRGWSVEKAVKHPLKS